MKKLLVWLLMAALCLTPVLGALGETVVDSTSDRGIVPQGKNAQGKWDLNPVVDGVNPVTGLPWTGTYVPVLVNIDNIKGARPQWGIAQADMIYELPIDGIGMTRLMALYATEYPEQVGPVRSARILHADMRQEWDAAWVFAGGQEAEGSNVYGRIRSYGLYDRKVNLVFNLLGQNGSPYSSNVKHHKSPHNHQVALSQVHDYLLSTGYEFTQRPYLFTDEPMTGDEAGKVVLDFGNGHSNSYLTYSADTQDYVRHITEGDALYVDYNTPDSPVTFNNVIVQWTQLTYYSNQHDRPNLTEVGEGNADFFMNGKHMSGYWVRTDADSRTVFFDSEGNEMLLQRGKTYVVVASPRFLEVRYE